MRAAGGAFVSLVPACPQPPGWPIIAGLALAAGFDAFCLVASPAPASPQRHCHGWWGEQGVYGQAEG